MPPLADSPRGGAVRGLRARAAAPDAARSFGDNSARRCQAAAKAIGEAVGTTIPVSPTTLWASPTLVVTNGSAVAMPSPTAFGKPSP